MVPFWKRFPFRPSSPERGRRQSFTGSTDAGRRRRCLGDGDGPGVRAATGKPAVILAILLGVFGLIQSRVPLRTAVQIGPDEGFEVAKVTLCLHGHKLYSEVWNDEPPLHT